MRQKKLQAIVMKNLKRKSPAVCRICLVQEHSSSLLQEQKRKIGTAIAKEIPSVMQITVFLWYRSTMKQQTIHAITSEKPMRTPLRYTLKEQLLKANSGALNWKEVRKWRATLRMAISLRDSNRKRSNTDMTQSCFFFSFYQYSLLMLPSYSRVTLGLSDNPFRRDIFCRVYSDCSGEQLIMRSNGVSQRQNSSPASPKSRGQISTMMSTNCQLLITLKKSPFSVTPAANTMQMTMICFPRISSATASVMKQMMTSIQMHLAAKLMKSPIAATNSVGPNIVSTIPTIFATTVAIISVLLVMISLRRVPDMTPKIPPMQTKDCSLSSSSEPLHRQSPNFDARDEKLGLMQGCLWDSGRLQTQSWQLVWEEGHWYSSWWKRKTLKKEEEPATKIMRDQTTRERVWQRPLAPTFSRTEQKTLLSIIFEWIQLPILPIIQEKNIIYRTTSALLDTDCSFHFGLSQRQGQKHLGLYVRTKGTLPIKHISLEQENSKDQKCKDVHWRDPFLVYKSNAHSQHRGRRIPYF